MKRPLQHPYEGPFEVLERHDKHMVLNVKGKKQTISIDRLKAAYKLNDELMDQPRDNSTRVTPSGHRVRFLA